MKKEIKFSLVFRDMWQSAGKYVPRVDQLVKVAPAIVEMGCFARVETNGGGFEQVNLLFGENPNKAVREWTKPFHEAGIQTHMLDRALNGLRMSPVPADVRKLFYKVKKAQGTDITRTFCGLNDIRNIAPSITYAHEAGMISQCSLCITHSPIHTVEYYTDMALKLIKLGADEICIKDMAGIGRPVSLGKIVANIKAAHPDIPIQYHSHVCAATGDKIIIDFRLNDAFMGDVVRGNSRRIYLNVTGESCIDYVDIVKNGQILARMNGPLTPIAPEGDTVRCKVKVDFGWNREEKYVHWQGKLSVDKGQIHSVTPCFRGAAFTSPQEGETEFHTHVNRIVSVGNKETELDMYSSKNPNTTTAAMQAVILDVEMPKDGKIIAEFNGKKFEHTLGELLKGSRSHFMIGWLSEAILFNRAMPESCFTLEHYMEDKEPQRDTDYYYVRVRQRDGQWAWSSPIWAERV